MLSREEEERCRLSCSLDEGVFEGDFENEVHLPIASSSLPTQVFSPSSSNQSSSTSLGDHRSRTYPRVSRPLTDEKVQVSPVFVPEPIEAGVIISPLRMSTSLPDSSAATRSLPVVAGSGSPSNEHFPLISTSLSSSSDKSIPSSPEYTRSAWNTPLRSASSSHRSSSPSINTPIVAMSSVSLSESSERVDVRDGHSEEEHQGHLDLDLGEMDDDLKFAIELSLAEARSRGEV
jgi:hypothetical protein